VKLVFQIVFGIILALVLLVAGCGALLGAGSSADDSPDVEHVDDGLYDGSDAEPSDAPGSSAVHQQIARSYNCSWLQDTFDRNMDRYEMMDALARQQEGSMGEVLWAYATEADDRMREIGCFG
jgi:hypothetical protein